MANAIYPKAKEMFLQGGINMNTGTVKVALIDTGTYTYSASHQYVSDISGVVGTAQVLSTKSFTNGVFDAADVTFPAVTGNTAEAILIYVDTGSSATSPLILFQDTGVTGLPVTPNGGDINLVFDNGAFKIFAL